MRLKLDENPPESAGPRLAALGFDVDTVLSEKLGGRDDATVWAAAQSERRFLVTQDLDFSDTAESPRRSRSLFARCMKLEYDDTTGAYVLP